MPKTNMETRRLLLLAASRLVQEVSDDSADELVDDLIAAAAEIPDGYMPLSSATDTVEDAHADRKVSVYDYEPDSFRRFFTTPFDEFAERIGEPFTVIGHETEDERSMANDGAFEDLYRIRFADGQEISAYGHEVCVLNRDKCK